jgi:hypothetical protein
LFAARIATPSQVHMYAVTRDGQRFLVREPAGNDSSQTEPLYIVTNWTTLVR